MDDLHNNSNEDEAGEDEETGLDSSLLHASKFQFYLIKSKSLNFEKFILTAQLNDEDVLRILDENKEMSQNQPKYREEVDQETEM